HLRLRGRAGNGRLVRLLLGDDDCRSRLSLLWRSATCRNGQGLADADVAVVEAVGALERVDADVVAASNAVKRIARGDLVGIAARRGHGGSSRSRGCRLRELLLCRCAIARSARRSRNLRACARLVELAKGVR